MHDLNLDFVKFDVSFIRNIETIPANQEFLRGAAGILHRMNLTVFGEGLSTEEEFKTLVRLNIDGMTGPHIGKLIK